MTQRSFPKPHQVYIHRTETREVTPSLPFFLPAPPRPDSFCLSFFFSEHQCVSSHKKTEKDAFLSLFQRAVLSVSPPRKQQNKKHSPTVCAPCSQLSPSTRANHLLHNHYSLPSFVRCAFFFFFFSFALSAGALPCIARNTPYPSFRPLHLPLSQGNTHNTQPSYPPPFPLLCNAKPPPFPPRPAPP